MVRYALVLTLVPFVAVNADVEEEVKKAQAEMVGSWVCIEEGGKKPDIEFILVIDKDGNFKVSGRSGNQAQLARLAGNDGKLKLSPAKKPPQISIVGARLTVPGLYKLEGERLVILVGTDLRQPESFDKTDGSFHVFVREKGK